MDFLGGEFLVEGEAHFGDEFGGVVSDDVCTEEFAVFFAVEEFGEAVGLASGDGFSDGDEGDFADGVFDAGFLEGAFGFSDGGDLGVAVGAAGEVVDFTGCVAGDVEAFDGLDGFEGGDVGEPWRAGDVASGVDAGDGGFVAVADLDVAAIGEGGLGAAGEDGLDADGDEADGGGDGAVFLGPFDGEGDGGAVVGGLGDLGVGEDADALFDEGFFEGVADFIVLDGEDAGGHFDECDLGAEGVVDVGELDADGAGADDDHFLGLLGEDHGLLGADDGGAVEGEVGEAAGFAAGGDEDVLGFVEGAAAVVADDADFSGAFDGAEAADVVDFVFLEEEFDAAGEAVGDFARAADDGGPVVGDAFDFEAELGGAVGEGVVEFGVFEESLGGEASPVEAGSAGAVGFDAGDFFTEL